MKVPTTNSEIAHLLRSVAAAYILEGKNRFRIIAYENAADTVEHLNRELVDLWENGELQGLSGIGPSISQHLDEYFKKGDKSYLVQTISKIPGGVFELMKIPGIGPKRAYKLVTQLKLKNTKTVADDLLKACIDDRVAQLETFGDKSQEEIIRALELYKSTSQKEDRMPLPYAYSLAQEIIHYLKKHRGVERVDALGSLRRWVSTIGDVDLAAVCKNDTDDVIKHFVSFPGKVKTEGIGPKKASIILANGRRVDLRIAPKQTYGAMLQYFTGSKAHNIKFREYGLKQGYSMSEYGIGKKRERGTVGRSKTFADEEKFYHFLGLQYIPPEIREGTNEIDLALKKQIPKLVELSDMKGELHVHSSFDIEPSHDLGQNTTVEMAKKAQSLRYEYLGISDHNPSQINHTHEDIIKIMKRRFEQFKKTRTVVPIIISCEVDILPDNGIALPDEALRYVDMVVVSIHSAFRMSKKDMTKRILRALYSPKVKVLGHPTGRMLPKREEIEADWGVIFKECKARNIALEVNSWPQRLDLPDILVRQAKEAGCEFVINTDAHAAAQMDNMLYGISVARRGWLTKSDIINTRSYLEVKKWIDKQTL